MDATVQPVVRCAGKRRYRRSDEKRRIVEETLTPGSIGGGYRASARNERQPGVSLAQAVSVRTSGNLLPNAPNLLHRERKRMARLLLEDVTLQKEKRVIAQVRFRGRALSDLVGRNAPS
jgi:hypothetical protein